MGKVGEAVFDSGSADATFQWGEALGRYLLPGDFVGLRGELGAGKTLFARGVSKGAGVALEEVASPSFAIVHSYRGRLPVIHADLYRLTGPEDLFSTGLGELVGGEAAVLVEWIDRFPSLAPHDHLQIRIDAPEGARPDERRFHVAASGERSSALLAAWLGALDADGVQSR